MHPFSTKLKVKELSIVAGARGLVMVWCTDRYFISQLVPIRAVSQIAKYSSRYYYCTCRFELFC